LQNNVDVNASTSTWPDITLVRLSNVRYIPRLYYTVYSPVPVLVAAMSFIWVCLKTALLFTCHWAWRNTCETKCAY